MRQCKCGNQVADNARACPRCGHRYTSLTTKVIAVFFALFGLAMIRVIAVSQGGSSSTPTVQSTPQRVSTGNVAQDRLTAMSPQMQALSLGKVTGEGCVGKRAFYMGTSPEDRSAFWSVGCKNGKSYMVQIHADSTGSTQVLDCGVYKIMAKGKCFVKLN